MPGQTAKSIVILSGPVGAGKTTVARELIDCSPAPVAYIEGDVFWQFVAKDTEPDFSLKVFKTTMFAMTRAAVPYALAGYETILDFSIPPWFLPTAIKVAHAKDVPLDYVVLRPSLEVCVSRAAGRKEGAITDYDRYRELYALFDEAGASIILNDSASPSEVATQIRSGLDAGKFRL